MFKLKTVLNQSFLRSIYRNYVSIVNIKADTVKSIKIIPDEYENSYQESEIRVEATDGDKNLIKLNEGNSKITKTKDEFNLEWLDKNEDTKIVIEIPLSHCIDLELNVNIKSKGQIKIDNIPKSKFVDVLTNDGNVLLNKIRAERLTAQGTEVRGEGVFAMILDLKGRTTNEGTIVMNYCQAEMMRAIGRRVSLESCYTHTIECKATEACVLRNLNGCAKIEASGDAFHMTAFSGTINADITTKGAVMHFAQLSDDSNIKFSNPEGIVRAGFAHEVVQTNTDLYIKSVAPIEAKSKDFVVCHIAENDYEIIRKNPESDSKLNLRIEKAKEVHLIKQSWIDSLKFEM